MLLNFAFNADPGFHVNADPDPASKNDADPDPQPYYKRADPKLCFQVIVAEDAPSYSGHQLAASLGKIFAQLIHSFLSVSARFCGFSLYCGSGSRFSLQHGPPFSPASPHIKHTYVYFLPHPPPPLNEVDMPMSTNLEGGLFSKRTAR
jgi:hypothetical protein